MKYLSKSIIPLIIIIFFSIISTITGKAVNVKYEQQDSLLKKSEIVNIKSYDIPLNEIPINEGYYSVSKDKGERIFASNNKEYFVFISWQVFDSQIEMYDRQGKIKWKASQKGYAPIQGLISNNGNVLFLWSFNEESESKEKLTLYNSKGDELFSDDIVYMMRSDYNNEVVYYTKNTFFSQKNDFSNRLYCFNSRTNKSWSLKIETSKPSSLLAVSGNGDCALFGNGFEIYCIDSKGEVIWQKVFKEGSNVHQLSYDGKNAIRLRTTEFWELLDKKGEVILRKEQEKIDNYSFPPISACFIKNDDKTIAITSDDISKKNLVALYNFKGDLLDFIQLSYEGVDCFVEVNSKGYYQIYFDNKFALEHKIMSK
jgi:hypothetical protein